MNIDELKILNVHFSIVTMQLCYVELGGVEPPTSCLQGRRSSQLSYSPKGIED